MSQRRYSPAEIWQAKALACEPEQLLPDGRACGDCHEFNGCLFVLDEPPNRDDRRCMFRPQPVCRQVADPRRPEARKGGVIPTDVANASHTWNVPRLRSEARRA